MNEPAKVTKTMAEITCVPFNCNTNKCSFTNKEKSVAGLIHMKTFVIRLLISTIYHQTHDKLRVLLQLLEGDAGLGLGLGLGFVTQLSHD
jgi:hypothetical protein